MASLHLRVSKAPSAVTLAINRCTGPRRGSDVRLFRSSAEPGQYLIAFHRNAQQDIGDVMQSIVINVVGRPVVTLAKPTAAAPGARVPVQISTGLGNSDRIGFWRDHALSSWDQSIEMPEFFDNSYEPAKPLIAPSKAGNYEIVYIFMGMDGPDAVAARLPLTDGAGAELEEAALHGDSMGDDIGYTCDQSICRITDARTGLSFALPQKWLTDVPTLGAYTAGGAADTHRAGQTLCRRPIRINWK